MFFSTELGVIVLAQAVSRVPIKLGCRWPCVLTTAMAPNLLNHTRTVCIRGALTPTYRADHTPPINIGLYYYVEVFRMVCCTSWQRNRRCFHNICVHVQSDTRGNTCGITSMLYILHVHICSLPVGVYRLVAKEKGNIGGGLTAECLGACWRVIQNVHVRKGRRVNNDLYTLWQILINSHTEKHTPTHLAFFVLPSAFHVCHIIR